MADPVYRGVPCVVFTQHGWYPLTIGPDHPDYAEMKARDLEAGLVLDQFDFERLALRGLLETLLLGPC